MKNEFLREKNRSKLILICFMVKSYDLQATTTTIIKRYFTYYVMKSGQKNYSLH